MERQFDGPSASGWSGLLYINLPKMMALNRLLCSYASTTATNMQLFQFRYLDWSDVKVVESHQPGRVLFLKRYLVTEIRYTHTTYTPQYLGPFAAGDDFNDFLVCLYRFAQTSSRFASSTSVCWDTPCSISVGPPDTALIPTKLFELPNLDLFLAQLQGFFPSLPSCLSMRS